MGACVGGRCGGAGNVWTDMRMTWTPGASAVTVMVAVALRLELDAMESMAAQQQRDDAAHAFSRQHSNSGDAGHAEYGR